MMRIAGSLDLMQVLVDLSSSRSIFHSEADFQHALAWQIHMADPLVDVRLETRATRDERLDLLVRRRDLGLTTAFELKYMTNATDVRVADERYVLPGMVPRTSAATTSFEISLGWSDSLRPGTRQTAL